MERIFNQFFSDGGNIIKTEGNFNPHRPIKNPEMPNSSHMRKSSLVDARDNPNNKSEVLKSNAQAILNPEEKTQIDIMNKKINNLQEKQEQENKELLEVIKKSIDYKNNVMNPVPNGPYSIGNNGYPSQMSQMNPMGVYSSVRPPMSYGNIPQHPMFNPFMMPSIPQVNKYNEYGGSDTPPAKRRRYKAMQLEELNENIELMQEELNKNIRNIQRGHSNVHLDDVIYEVDTLKKAVKNSLEQAKLKSDEEIEKIVNDLKEMKLELTMKINEKNFKNDNALHDLEEDFKTFKGEINEKISNFDLRQEAQLESIRAILEGLARKKQNEQTDKRSWKDAVTLQLQRKNSKIAPLEPRQDVNVPKKSILIPRKDQTSNSKIKYNPDEIYDDDDNAKAILQAKDKDQSKPARRKALQDKEDEKLNKQIEDLKNQNDDILKGLNNNKAPGWFTGRKKDQLQPQETKKEENKQQDPKKDETIEPYKRQTKSKEKNKELPSYMRDKSPPKKDKEDDKNIPSFKKGTKARGIDAG